MAIPGWLIHRRIGMSGGLFTRALARELGRDLTEDEMQALQRRHGELFVQLLPVRRPLPGAMELLRFLRETGSPSHCNVRSTASDRCFAGRLGSVMRRRR